MWNCRPVWPSIAKGLVAIGGILGTCPGDRRCPVAGRHRVIRVFVASHPMLIVGDFGYEPSWRMACSCPSLAWGTFPVHPYGQVAFVPERWILALRVLEMPLCSAQIGEQGQSICCRPKDLPQHSVFALFLAVAGSREGGEPPVAENSRLAGPGAGVTRCWQR